MALPLAGSAVGEAGSAPLVISHVEPLFARPTDDRSAALTAGGDKIAAELAAASEGEVAVLAERAVVPGAVALQAVERFVGAAHAFLVVEEVGLVSTAGAGGAAIAGDAALERGVAGHALARLIRVIEVLEAGEAEAPVPAGLAVRQVHGAQLAGRVVEVVRVRNALAADVPLTALLAPRTELPAGHALPALHERTLIAPGAGLRRAALAVLERDRALLAPVVQRVV